MHAYFENNDKQSYKTCKNKHFFKIISSMNQLMSIDIWGFAIIYKMSNKSAWLGMVSQKYREYL
jgi:hypothetical protein